MLNNTNVYTFGKFFVILLVPLILLTCNTFADSPVEELHKESAMLVSQERYNEALDIFDQILEIDPNNVKALINRSAVLITIGEYQKGINDTDRILTIEPNNIKALSNKGKALANIGLTYDAIENFEKAIEIDPDNYELKKNRNYLFPFVDLLPTKTQERYDVHVQAQVRTQNDELISVTEGVMGEYLPFNIINETLNNYPIIDNLEKNGKNYEMIQITHRANEYEHKTYGHLQLNTMCDEVSGCLNIFAGRTPSILVDSGDYMIVQWTIYRLVE